MTKASSATPFWQAWNTSAAGYPLLKHVQCMFSLPFFEIFEIFEFWNFLIFRNFRILKFLGFFGFFGFLDFLDFL